jgi:glutamate/tyrosine decarboxylase-like PLP-dependent enzyme
MSHQGPLERAAAHAVHYLDRLDDAAVGPHLRPAELHARFGGPLPDDGLDPDRVIDDLVRDVDGGLMGSTGGRFFGWVIGGVLPAALAADWLTSTWDQNAAVYATSPAAAAVEEVCGEWLKELLGLPSTATFALVTGCQMAHVTALAAARQSLYADRGIDIQRAGLAGAPQLRVIASEHRHASVARALRLLGIGTDSIVEIPADHNGISLSGLAAALAADRAAPTLVCLQAGELCTGVFDRFEEACRLAHEHRAWVHVDGAFGLWAAASERYRHLVAGVARADSWATDGHKWLNVPYDCGFAFVADPRHHRAAMTVSASYFDAAEAARDSVDWNPEWSRRARAFPVYAAIRSLGRAGIADLVDRCCSNARAIVAGIGELAGAEVIAMPVINQGLVRFLSPDGDHDRMTDEVIARIQADGEAWFGGAEWEGNRVMRVSVSSWRTTEQDVERVVRVVGAALEARSSVPAA